MSASTTAVLLLELLAAVWPGVSLGRYLRYAFSEDAFFWRTLVPFSAMTVTVLLMWWLVIGGLKGIRERIACDGELEAEVYSKLFPSASASRVPYLLTQLTARRIVASSVLAGLSMSVLLLFACNFNFAIGYWFDVLPLIAGGVLGWALAGESEVEAENRIFGGVGSQSQAESIGASSNVTSISLNTPDISDSRPVVRGVLLSHARDPGVPSTTSPQIARSTLTLFEGICVFVGGFFLTNGAMYFIRPKHESMFSVLEAAVIFALPFCVYTDAAVIGLLAWSFVCLVGTLMLQYDLWRRSMGGLVEKFGIGRYSKRVVRRGVRAVTVAEVGGIGEVVDR